MSALLSKKKFERLQKSVDWSIRQMEKPRKERVDSVKQLVGSHYAEGGTEKHVPVNFEKLAVDIYVRQLAPCAPRAMISTNVPELRPIAANEELAVNQIPDEISLDKTLKMFVTEALFSLGVVKVGLCTRKQVLGCDYGESFVDVVTMDDYFFDASAKRQSAMQYEGNDYWMPFEDIESASWVPDKYKKDLKPDDYTLFGPNGEDRAEEITTTETPDLYKEKIWLRDVWLPAENLLVTYAVISKKLLSVVKWDGPKDGPYIKLGFSHVPGNILPLAPVSVWKDLHKLANTIFRKLGRQAEAQKNVAGFSGGNEDSVRNLRDAKDGDGIAYTGPPPIDISVGGIDQNNLAFFLQCRDLYSYFAGNLDSLGGLSPMSDTVGQDKLLSESAGAMLREMADETVRAIGKIFKALAYYEWSDPIKRRILEKSIPGTEIKLPIPWGKKQRKGKFEDFRLDIDVYSLQDNSPSIKLQKLGMVIQNYVLPLAPMIQQQGGSIDAQVILRLVAKYANLPELAEIVQFTQGDMESQEQQPPGMPQNTTRTYERVNRPGASISGKSQILQQAALGGQPQKSEIAALTRPTG
jgi:hypothetical protein